MEAMVAPDQQIVEIVDVWAIVQAADGAALVALRRRVCDRQKRRRGRRDRARWRGRGGSAGERRIRFGRRWGGAGVGGGTVGSGGDTGTGGDTGSGGNTGNGGNTGSGGRWARRRDRQRWGRGRGRQERQSAAAQETQERQARQDGRCVGAGGIGGAAGSGSSFTPAPVWGWTGVVGTGQSLAVGGHGNAPAMTIGATTQPFHNLKLSLGNATVPPFTPTNAALSMVPLVEPLRTITTTYPSPYPANIYGESFHTAMSDELTSLAISAGKSDFVSTPDRGR